MVEASGSLTSEASNAATSTNLFACWFILSLGARFQLLRCILVLSQFYSCDRSGGAVFQSSKKTGCGIMI